MDNSVYNISKTLQRLKASYLSNAVSLPWVEKVIISCRPAKKMKIQLINENRVQIRSSFGFVVKTSFSLDLLFDGTPGSFKDEISENYQINDL